MSPFRVAPFAFDRSWHFPVPREDFWSIVRRTDQFPVWWGWLRSFESEGLEPGTTTRFVVQGPLPYRLEFAVHVDRVIEPRRVETSVHGDLEGPATLEVDEEDSGCRARLTWLLEPHDPLIRRLSMVSHGLLAWSHDQVVSMGVAQFRRRIPDLGSFDGRL